MQINTCCFFGHRETEITEKLKLKVLEIVENLVVDKNVDIFLFGSKSKFNDLCYDVVDDLKEKYPHIKRIYVRAEYPYINDNYKNYLLEFYEDTYYPESVLGANRAVYVKRNYEMIDKSHYCIFYYNEEIALTKRKSGTKIALDYARKKGKEIMLLKTNNK